MIASRTGRPSSPTGTVPDHWAVQQTAITDSGAAAPVRGDDPPEPPAVLTRGDDPPEPPAVPTRGDDPPEPPAVAVSRPAARTIRSHQSRSGSCSAPPPGSSRTRQIS